MNSIASLLHDATHRIPGVPAHRDATPTRRAHRTRTGPRLQNPARHHEAPPRILVTWQNRIARLVRNGSHR